MSAVATDRGPLFREPPTPMPRATCRHCGHPVRRQYSADLWRHWVHDEGGTGCPTNTSADPAEDTAWLDHDSTAGGG